MSWDGTMPPRQTVQMIIDDIVTDVDAMEGKPFTGRVVAEHFGIIRAQLLVMSKLVDHAFERIEELETDK